MKVLQRAKQLQKSIVEARRLIHANPELSFQEHKTAAYASSKLQDIGFATQDGVGKTGVMANLGKGKTVAIRADMDALPIDEASQAPYSSSNPGVMHACGHDAHVACAIAAAQILKDEGFSGRVRMLMQPSEECGDSEGKSGAARMIEDGAMKDVDSVIGLHVMSTLPSGKVAIMPGPIMASADSFAITITGKGGHGAYPHLSVDPISLSGLVLQSIQNIISRRLKAGEQAVVSVCAIESDSKRYNIISESVTMKGTIRSFSEETRSMLQKELVNACEIVKPLGGMYHIEYDFGFALTVNNEEITAVMRQAACDLIGADNVITVEPQMGSEDFSLLAREAPGAFMFLGVGYDDGKHRMHHSATFDIDETPLCNGSAILAETAKRLMI